MTAKRKNHVSMKRVFEFHIIKITFFVYFRNILKWKDTKPLTVFCHNCASFFLYMRKTWTSLKSGWIQCIENTFFLFKTKNISCYVANMVLILCELYPRKKYWYFHFQFSLMKFSFHRKIRYPWWSFLGHPSPPKRTMKFFIGCWNKFSLTVDHGTLNLPAPSFFSLSLRHVE